MLYDIELTHQDTTDSDGIRFPIGTKFHKRLTVTVTPYVPLIVPPGSTLVINRSNGVPEAHMTGAGTQLVTRGDKFYEQSQIIDGYLLESIGDAAPEYIACASERLIEDAIRNIAEFKVKELLK